MAWQRVRAEGGAPRGRRQVHRPAGIRASVVATAVLAAGCAGGSSSPPTGAPAATPAEIPAASVTTAPSDGPIVPATFDDLRRTLRDIAALAPVDAQRRVDALWSLLVAGEHAPLVLDRRVVFMYRGDAAQVDWRGSFNGWSAPGLAGVRVGETDLWIGLAELPAASRAEYKIVVDGNDWVVDPANPRMAYSGLTGINNVVTTPGFEVTDESAKRADSPAGALDAGQSIRSRHLGCEVHYWVYTPSGYPNLGDLPVLYLLDGNDFVDERMGALPVILDNLIASGRIDPLIAVFVDARDPADEDVNRREDEFLVHPVEHAGFLAEELVPAVDAAYRTVRDPDARTVAGVSFGGISSLFVAASRAETFHNVAALSPSLWVLDSPQYLEDLRQREGSRLMQPAMQAALDCGDVDRETCPPLRVFLSAGLPDWDVGDLGSLAAALEASGYAVDYRPVREGHTWGQWRGLADEMLTFFFGRP